MRARSPRSGSRSWGQQRFWWLYFNSAAALVRRRLELSADRTLAARDAYTYLHVVIVLGVIVAAVGDELVIAHPTEVLPGEEVAAVVAGPSIYLLASRCFASGWSARSARRDSLERSPVVHAPPAR